MWNLHVDTKRGMGMWKRQAARYGLQSGNHSYLNEKTIITIQKIIVKLQNILLHT